MILNYTGQDLSVDRSLDLYYCRALNKLWSFSFVVNRLGARGRVVSFCLNPPIMKAGTSDLTIDWLPCKNLAWTIKDPAELIEAFNDYGFRMLSPLEQLAEVAE